MMSRTFEHFGLQNDVDWRSLPPPSRMEPPRRTCASARERAGKAPEMSEAMIPSNFRPEEACTQRSNSSLNGFCHCVGLPRDNGGAAQDRIRANFLQRAGSYAPAVVVLSCFFHLPSEKTQ